MVTIGRRINGISVNPFEFLLNNEGELIKFNTVEEAHQFMRDHGFSETEITESHSYFDEETGEQI